MSEEFGPDIITVVDDDGNEINLEVLDRMDYKSKSYVAFLPADMDENDPDYGMIILRSIWEDEGESFEDVEDQEELVDVYNHFMVLLYGDDYDAEEHPEEE